MPNNMHWITGTATKFNQTFCRQWGPEENRIPRSMFAWGSLVWDDSPANTPICVNHTNIEISRGSLESELTADGLQIRFPVWESNPDTREFLHAAKFRPFAGFSLGFEVTRCHSGRDRFGKIRIITEAIIHEISICDEPLIAGTSARFECSRNLSLNNHKDPTVRVDRIRLERFLQRIGYDDNHASKPARAIVPIGRKQGKPSRSMAGYSRECRAILTWFDSPDFAAMKVPPGSFDPQPYIPPPSVLEKIGFGDPYGTFRQQFLTKDAK